MKSKVKGYIFPVLAVLTVSAFPSLFLYCRNADEAGFSEIVPALLISVAAGLVLFGLAVLFTRNLGKAAISASLLMLVVLNFTFLENGLKLILPRLKYWHTVPIILVVALHIIYFLCRFLKNETAGDVTKILCLVFGGLIVLNVATSTPQIINHVRAQRELKEALAHRGEQQGTAAEDMPNVYLLIFDEYANFPQMEEYYNYDNAPLKEFLEENNFNISYTSHNESIASITIQTNMINLDYIVDDSVSVSDKEVLRKNGALFDLMRRNGYRVQILERTDFYGGTLPGKGTSANLGASTINGENLMTVLAKQMIVYPFLSKKQSGLKEINEYLEIVDYLKKPLQTKDSVFTLAYFCFPHQPFIVDENGKEITLQIDPMSTKAWDDKQIYLGQYKFATKMMISMIGGIIENDPNAVVLLMSDHGARGIGLDGKPLFIWSSMINSLNAVYYQGRHLDIEGLSNVNTIRTILNELFHMDYQMVEIPDGVYGYKDFEPEEG